MRGTRRSTCGRAKRFILRQRIASRSGKRGATQTHWGAVRAAPLFVALCVASPFDKLRVTQWLAAQPHLIQRGKHRRQPEPVEGGEGYSGYFFAIFAQPFAAILRSTPSSTSASLLM